MGLIVKVLKFIRDPLVEKILAGLGIAVVVSFFGWWSGFIGPVWEWLWQPVEVWLWIFWSLLLTAGGLTAMEMVRRFKSKPLYEDENDVLGVLTDWVGHYKDGISAVAINYKDTDRKLRLTPGSTEKFVARAAATYRYRVLHKGKETITFEGGY
jgi:hypothetical protein